VYNVPLETVSFLLNSNGVSRVRIQRSKSPRSFTQPLLSFNRSYDAFSPHVHWRERKKTKQLSTSNCFFLSKDCDLFLSKTCGLCLGDTYPPHSDFNEGYQAGCAHLRKKDPCERHNLCDQVHQTINPHIFIHKHANSFPKT